MTFFYARHKIPKSVNIQHTVCRVRGSAKFKIFELPSVSVHTGNTHTVPLIFVACSPPFILLMRHQETACTLLIEIFMTKQ